MKIVTENLGKRFNREWIFRKMSLTFESGTTYAIVGPNGSGKSTLMQILWGQLPATTGKIEFSNPTAIPIDEIFQDLVIATPYLELIEEFTLHEMVRFHFRFKKPRGNMSHPEIIDRMELAAAGEKLISNFSSGMKQRLKLGLAFFSESKILFLDEPTTNLDSRATAWYDRQMSLLPNDLLVFIASNQPSEYPSHAQKIDILTYK